jgi:hypothetical protein
VPAAYGAYSPYGPYGPYSPYGGGYGTYGAPRRPSAPKPGIVPLRPLGVGEILDGAFTAMKWNPRAVLIPSAAVATLNGVLTALVAFVWERRVLSGMTVSAQGTISRAQAGQFAGTSFAIYGVSLTFGFIATTILTALLTVVIGQGVLGRKETFGSAWRTTRSRIWAALGAVLLTGPALIVGWMAAIALSAGVGVLLGAGAHLVAVGVLVGSAAGITATVFAVMIWIRWSLVIPVVLLERARPVVSLRRSWRLVRRGTWRVFGILLLTELIVGLARMVIQVPFVIASGGIGGFVTRPSSPSVTSASLSAIGGIIGGTVTTPLLAGVIVLLYADLRMRREGMDIDMQAASASGGQDPQAQAHGGGDPGGQGRGPW